MPTVRLLGPFPLVGIQGNDMKDFVTLACIMLSVIVGLPSLLLGMAGVAGGLADVSYWENVQFGIPLLVAGVSILAASGYWIWRQLRHRP